MKTTQPFPGRCFHRLLLLLLLLTGSLLVAQANPSVLILGHGYGNTLNSYDDPANPWVLLKLLNTSFGFDVGSCSFADLATTDASVNGTTANTLLRQFNAVMVCDLARIVVGYSGAPSSFQISQTDYNRLVSNLLWYVNQGGGLYIYGNSFTAASNWDATDTLNQFLTPNLDATVAFEELHDTAREAQQADGRKVRYALANTIAAHAATTNVSNFWYPVGEHSHGPWTKPLLLGPAWTRLISASTAFTTIPMTHTDPTVPGGTSIIPPTPPACFYACRTFGSNGGRIILNGSESTISIYNYHYSLFADTQWGVYVGNQWFPIGMEYGLNGTASDGLPLLVSSLTWLTAPTLGVFGPYSPPAPVKETANPISWNQGDTIGSDSFYKGAIGAKWSPDGSTATVAQYATQAASMGLGFLVCVADFADPTMNQTQWNNFVSTCQAYTTANLLIVPALLTQDAQNNRFLQCSFNALNWPQASRLTSGRVTDHLGYWLTDNNAGMRIPYKFSLGSYPPWLFSAFNAFPLRTYENNVLVTGEDRLTDYQQSMSEGNWPVPVALTFVTSTVGLAAAPEFSYLKASSQNDLQAKFTANNFLGNPYAYVSSGPAINYFSSNRSFRSTAAQLYLRGTERWRVYARATAKAGATLTNVKLYNGTQVIRNFDVTGTTWSANIDLLQDHTTFLTLVVTDTSGRAVSRGIGNSDDLFRQYFCSDRCNIMSGLSAVQEVSGGLISRNPASSNVNRAGWLYYNTTAANQFLPGIDQIFAAYLTINPKFTMTTTAGLAEPNAEVHDINWTYHSADVIRYDTPILKRTTNASSTTGHYPYMPLVNPNVGANLTQYHFYRNPAYPSPMIAEMSMTITDPAGVTLGNGWHNLHQYYGMASSTLIHSYVIVRADNTVISGPTNTTTTQVATQYGTLWTGTLNPGDYVLFPDIAEGFFVLGNQGPCYVEIQCTVPNNWFRLYLGRNDTATLPVGSVSSVRLLNLKTIDIVGLANQTAMIAQWSSFRDMYGIKTGAPIGSYTVTPTQGSVTNQRYMLELAASSNGFTGAISQANLPQRLPVKITGLNPNWSAGKLDLTNNQWFPLSVLSDGSAYTTINPIEGSVNYYLGSMLTLNNANVAATLLPANTDGYLYADLHNPTASDQANVQVTVPVDSFLAPPHTTAGVTVPHGSTTRVKLTTVPKLAEGTNADFQPALTTAGIQKVFTRKSDNSGWYTYGPTATSPRVSSATNPLNTPAWLVANSFGLSGFTAGTFTNPPKWGSIGSFENFLCSWNTGSGTASDKSITLTTRTAPGVSGVAKVAIITFSQTNNDATRYIDLKSVTVGGVTTTFSPAIRLDNGTHVANWGTAFLVNIPVNKNDDTITLTFTGTAAKDGGTDNKYNGIIGLGVNSLAGDPVDLGEIYCSAAVGHPNNLSNLDVGTPMIALGYPRLAYACYSGDGLPIPRSTYNSEVDNNGRTKYPDWLDKTNSIPIGEFDHVGRGGYFHPKWTTITYCYGINGFTQNLETLTSKTFTLTLVPAAGTNTTKRLAVCAYAGYIFLGGGDATVTIDSITVGDVPYTLPTRITFPSGQGDYYKARGFQVPIQSGKNVVITVTVTRPATTKAVGVQLAFEE